MKILPFDAKQLSMGVHTNIETPEELLKKLKEDNKNPDKPLRILVGENNLPVIVKFGFGEDLIRGINVRDEYNNLKILNECKNIPPHVSHMKWSTKIGETSSYLLFFQYLPPFDNFHNLRDVATRGNEDMWKKALFQTLFTIAWLQVNFPGFRHNDLKADNVLVTESDCLNLSYSLDLRSCSSLPLSQRIRRVWDMESRISSKIIDFELANTPEGKTFKSETAVNGNKDLLESFGLYEFSCNAYDVHLLLYDCLLNSKKNIFYNKLLSFCLDFFPDSLFQQENVGPNYRMLEKDQRLYEKDNFIIFRMLSHPYFFEFRTYPQNDSMFEIKVL